MTKPASKRVKVFAAQIGFYDTVVAAPSQAAALRAWGIRQNLFATGDAQTTQEASAVAAALNYPGKPLRRAVGSNDAFKLEPTGLPQVPDAPKKQFQKTKAKTAAQARPIIDRAKLDAAEASLLELIERRKQEEADFQREKDAFAVRRTAAQELYVQNHGKATAAIEAARQQYRKEGGTD